MPIYVALLRGINVGRGKVVKMERLRTMLETLGLTEVRTYVQSGNVVFVAKEESAEKLAKKIEELIKREFGFDVPVLVKRATEFEAAVKRNPLAKKKGIDREKLHVTFLSGAAPKEADKLLAPLATEGEQLRSMNREIYLYCPNGYGRTKLSNTTIEKKLGLVATTRNCRTVNALVEMALGSDG